MKAPQRLLIRRYLRQYLALGYRPFIVHGIRHDGTCTCNRPHCASPGKHPLSVGWNRDIAKVDNLDRDLLAMVDVNIGLATGAGLVVIDIDPRHGGIENIQRLQDEFGAFPACPTVQTGGGGVHFYFRSATRIGSSAGQIAPGIDVKGDGGGVVAPPSVHFSGKPYTWIRPLTSEFPPLPEWLELRARQSRRVSEFSATDVSLEGFAEGERNVGMAKLLGKLMRHGIPSPMVLSLAICFDEVRNKPPLGKREVIAIAKSIASREVNRRRS
jgi:hypothetical protein